jgi:predicted ATPase/DNA-binding CsgD family transcriptional regulator
MVRRPKKRVAKRLEGRRPTQSGRQQNPAPPRRNLHNLPTQLNSFIGREREIAEVKRLLAATRLLTLTGTGGCGKTRLALQAVADLLPDCADGVWIVDLAVLSDPTFVPQTVASTLRVPERPGRPLTDSLVDALRTKSLLLLLDNCEHLLDACGQLADALLRQCPNIRILATSRERLGIAGELAYRVPSLSLPRPDHPPLLEDVAQYEAVRLFIDRAALSHPEFRVTTSNVSATVQVCLRLDGIPLAIELAAARVKALTVEQVAARLDDRFGLLTGGSRAALPRQRTLRATMDWSYALLSEKEQALLRRLAVFAGACTLEAVEAVCAGGGFETSEILDLLTQLLDKSLVQVENREGEARYRLLETVREYGRVRLSEAGETDETQRRHRDWYLAFAERAEPEMRGPNQIAWLERLEENHDNFRAALEWSRTDHNGNAPGLRLATALYEFWEIHGHFAEARTWLDEMLRLSEGAAPALRVKALNHAGHLAYSQGDHSRVAVLCGEALALSDAAGDRSGQARALHYLAHAEEGVGDHRRAAELLERSVAVYRTAGSRLDLARALHCLANAMRFQTQYHKTVPLFEEALTIFQTLSDTRGRATTLHNLGYLALSQGDHRQAWTLFRESLTLARELGDRRVLNCLAGLAGTSSTARPRWAARLFGAVGTLMSAAGAQLEPANRPIFDQHMAATKRRLGERAFSAAWAKGATMTLDQAIAYALADEGTTPPGDLTVPSLTAREREVASLIAQGLTNREIASRLVIAERTVDAHVEHILNKLGYSSRTRIAVWAVEAGLRDGSFE